MPFNYGTGITDHIGMLDALTTVVTSDYVDTAVVAGGGGGTGYTVGEVLTVAGGTVAATTGGVAALLEVTSVSGGAIDGIRVLRAGTYTSNPATSNSPTTTGNDWTGTVLSSGNDDCTITLTMGTATWAVNRRTQEAASAAVGTSGTGYNIGDILTLTDGGTTIHGDVDSVGTQGTTATFTVATLTGGAGTGVATVTVLEAGNYEEVPANDVGTTNDGSGDDACELTVTWQDGTKTNNDFQVCMLEGEGSAGTDEIHVVIKAYALANGFDTAFNWALMGCTGYNSGLPLQVQPGINSSTSGAQIHTTSGALPTTDTGAYIALKDTSEGANIEWWINHTGRRIVLVAKCAHGGGVTYSSCYLGFLNQFGTDTEYPYPLWVSGGFAESNHIWTETNELLGGVTEVFDRTSTASQTTGGGWVRTPAGAWQAHACAGSTNASIRTVKSDHGIYPYFTAWPSTEPTAGTGDVGWAFAADEMIPATLAGATPDLLLQPTPGTGDDYYWLVAPALMVRDTWPTSYTQYGEIDGVFWFSGGLSGPVAEDRFELTSKRYRIFQNGNQTESYSYFAMDED